MRTTPRDAPGSARALLAVALSCLLAGCGSTPDPRPPAEAATSSSRPTAPDDDSPAPLGPGVRPHVGDHPQILFLGNSHTQRHDVPGTVAALLAAGHPSIEAEVATAPGLLHLDERATDDATLSLLDSQQWDVVVLQAQNYSLSGATDYPVDGSVALVREVREQGGLPVLYAEWARRGIDETDLILQTYAAIARQEPACLPPVPETFDLAHATDRGLVLIDTDGNHATAAGAFLASLVLFATISGQDVAALPDVPTPGVPPDVQQRLRAVAADALAEVSPARGCPEVR